MNGDDKQKLPIVIARDVWVDDVTSDLPILRIKLPDGTGFACRLAPDACRVLGIALTAAADVADHDVYDREAAVARYFDERPSLLARLASGPTNCS